MRQIEIETKVTIDSPYTKLAEITFSSTWIDGRRLDTNVDINTNFVIAGNQLENFTKEFNELVKKYAI